MKSEAREFLELGAKIDVGMSNERERSRWLSLYLKFGIEVGTLVKHQDGRYAVSPKYLNMPHEVWNKLLLDYIKRQAPLYIIRSGGYV